MYMFIDFDSFNESLRDFLLYIGPMLPFALVFGCSLGFFFYLLTRFVAYIRRDK